VGCRAAGALRLDLRQTGIGAHVANRSLMPRARLLWASLAPVAIALLAGCGGSGTRVVTSNRPTEPLTSASSVHTESAPQISTSTANGAASAGAGSGGTAAQAVTRTQSAPAYVHEESPSGAAGQAVAVVKAHGYTPSSTSTYHPGQSLRVLVGTRTGSGDGYNQQAFFFLGGRYLGTDTSQPSAAVRVVSQGDTEVTLAYRIYRPGDPLCCPGGGEKQVTFQLNNGALAPAQPIPPVSERR
jgi:LppP/LprE lipoprotein